MYNFELTRDNFIEAYGDCEIFYIPRHGLYDYWTFFFEGSRIDFCGFSEIPCLDTNLEYTSYYKLIELIRSGNGNGFSLSRLVNEYKFHINGFFILPEYLIIGDFDLEHDFCNDGIHTINRLDYIFP